MRPEMVRTFIDEFHREVNRQASEQDARRDYATLDLAKTEREISRLIEAIKAGVPGGAVKDEMTTLKLGEATSSTSCRQRPLPHHDCTPTLPRYTEKNRQSV